MVDVSNALPSLDPSGNQYLSFDLYQDFVVQVPAETVTEGGVEEAMLELMQNTTALQQKQRKLAQYAKQFVYAMGRDAHLHHDAFYNIILALSHYVQHYATTRPLTSKHE